jgi:predicted enzyme related to lactoylglutathione lyase
MKVNFNAVLIGVKNILKSKVFYENVFGIVFDEVRPPFSNFYLNGIEFMVEEDTDNREEGWAEKYIGRETGICLEVDNLELFLKLVIDNNGKIIQESKEKPWGTIESKFSDPYGNIFIIEQNL